VFILTIF